MLRLVARRAAQLSGAAPTSARPGTTLKQQLGASASSYTTKPAESDLPTCPAEEKHDFQGFVDLYLGDIWMRLESEMRRKAGEDLEYDVNIQSGCMSLALPENGRMRICKDPDHCALIVSTNMHDFLGSGETTTEVSFAFRDGVFQSEGQMLHEFLEDGIAKHMKVQLDLEPELDKSYNL